MIVRFDDERPQSVEHEGGPAAALHERTGPVSCDGAVVVIDSDGLFLPAIDGTAAMRLALADLELMAASVGVPSARADVGEVARLEELFGGRAFAIRPVTEPPQPTGSPSPPNRGGSRFHLVTPLALRLSRWGYVYFDHTGRGIACFTPRQLFAALAFLRPSDIPNALLDQAIRMEGASLSGDELDEVIDILLAARLLTVIDDHDEFAGEGRAVREYRAGLALLARRRADVADALETFHADEARREADTGRVRTAVVPVNSEGQPMLSLGLLMATAAAYDGGRLSEEYKFVPDWADHTVPQLTPESPPGIYLFSNYIWSHAWNVVRSADVKGLDPRNITIHGGPNTPKYDADVEAFFGLNPSVDVVVHGEGEMAFVEILDALSGCFEHGGTPDLSVLETVPGLSVRIGDKVVKTEGRERIADLDTLPSPYRSGIFDSIGFAGINHMAVESNRGCPYGCTYCDWGSATLSRIRKFELERVFDELEWCAKHKVKVVFCADANFGIFARDVEIARKVVELNQTYGYPKVFESSYAKNTVKHLREIIELLAKGGVLSTGTISLQSVDPDTLDAIRRSNIRLDKYDELAVEFGIQGLPLVAELMMGLPGSTMESYLGDLQQCIDREVKARVNPTEVLMNSPMNAPEYRDEHAIRTIRPVNQDWSVQNESRKKALIVSTATFTREEYDLMERYRRIFLLSENYSVLRQVARFVRHETGTDEIDFYVRLTDEAHADPERWPMLSSGLDLVIAHMIPPVSWSFFIDEVRDYLVNRLGIAEDSALETVLAVQHALLPARDRTFPLVLELPHDFGAWHQTMIDHKRAGNTATWQQDLPHLSTYGPGTFVVEDPQGITVAGFGMPMFHDADSDWELGSPAARPMRFRHTIQN